MLVLAALASACSSDADDQTGEALARPVADCDATAAGVVERLVEFASPFQDLAPEEFLAQPELDGIEDYRSDVAGMLINEDCNAEVFEGLLDTRLQALRGESLLIDFLVGAIRSDPAERETRDVVVEPGDDLAGVLGSLGGGSTVTLTSGVHEVDETLLVQVDLVLIGESRERTEIRSSAGDAAIAVFGDGQLDLRQLSLLHVGSKRSSGVLSFAAPVAVADARVSGAVADDDGIGGVGLLLSAAQIIDADGDALGTGNQVPSARIVDSEIIDNDFAGVVIAGSLEAAVEGNVASDNGGCGVCFFDGATGFAQANTIANNEIGVQISEGAVPDVASNLIEANTIAGVLIDGDGAAAVFDNDIAGNGEAGVDVQGSGEPLISDNRFASQPFSLSLRGTTRATAQNNDFVGGEVGLLVGEQATPTAIGNVFRDQSLAALQHEGGSAGEFTDNAVEVTPDGDAASGVGVIVRGQATPAHRDLVVSGGAVGVFAGEQSEPQFKGARLRAQQVGLQVDDIAAPVVSDSVITSSLTSGVIWAGEAGGELTTSKISDPPEIVVQIGGTSTPSITANGLEGGGTGVLVVDAAMPLITQNEFRGQEFAIGVSGVAAPSIRANEIVGASQVAVSFEDESSGELADNRIIETPLVGVRVTGSSTATISENQLAALRTETPGDGRAVGLLFDDAASGDAEANVIVGFAIGIQVSGASKPAIRANNVDGASVGVVGVLYSDEAAGAALENTTVNQPIGFQASADTSPKWTSNTVENATAAAYLLQGTARPVLDQNNCPNLVAAGIAVLEQASPLLGSNDCPLVRQ